MSAPEGRSVRVDGRDAVSRPVRRVRHDARDGLAAAALSLTASIGVTAALWLLLRWLG